jgi:hypothetical protein
MTSLLKIDRPPAAEHWSRMQHPDVSRTARKYFNFLRGSPRWSYQPCRLAARYYIEDRISRAVAMRVIQRRGSPLGWKHNEDAVNAFYDLVELFPIEGLHAFSDLVEWFPIAPKAAIPIKPLSVTREKGSFVPNLLNPWSEIAFDGFQASLYMTILEKSLFRLTDFENSPGRIIFLPKMERNPGEWCRTPVVWSRGQFPLLSDRELNEQMRVFAESKEIAKVLYQEYLDRKDGK